MSGVLLVAAFFEIAVAQRANTNTILFFQSSFHERKKCFRGFNVNVVARVGQKMHLCHILTAIARLPRSCCTL